jgi:alkyldihydroxyacetonephosphate synthase
MLLTREQIVEGLKKIIDPENVITDEEVLKENSYDRFRKYEGICKVYTRPTPAALVKVKSAEDVSKVLSYLNENGVNVVPRTGGSSVEGGLEPSIENSVIIDGSEMNKIINIDTYNMLATVQCGVPLQYLEDRLREIGYTTGHQPQSKPLAQMGGLVATRSTGHFSTLYGGIEDMVVGIEAVFPNGQITRIKNVPRRAAGPDIRHIIIGNEGAICFITEVTVKIFKYYPENNLLYGYLVEDMKTGFEFMHRIMVEGYKPSVLRLYDEEDGVYSFGNFSKGKCVLVAMAEGPKLIADATGKFIESVAEEYKLERIDDRFIKNWFDNLTWDEKKIEEEKNEIIQTNNIGYTIEISGNWGVIDKIYSNAIKRVREEIPDITLIGVHSSHSYLNGTNLYFTIYYNLVDIKPEEDIIKYHIPFYKVVIEETLRYGGSISHHHGMGKYKALWVKEEYGSSYYILETLKEAFDPNLIMNAGTIIPLE